MAKYIVETDGLMLGVVNDEELQLLLEGDTKGYSIYRCDKAFNKAIKAMKNPWYKFSIKDNELVIEELKFVDKKPETLYYLDDELVYITDRGTQDEVDIYLDMVNDALENGYDSNCQVNYFLDKIDVQDNHPERTAKIEERSKAMLESLLCAMRTGQF